MEAVLMPLENIFNIFMSLTDLVIADPFKGQVSSSVQRDKNFLTIDSIQHVYLADGRCAVNGLNCYFDENSQNECNTKHGYSVPALRLTSRQFCVNWSLESIGLGQTQVHDGNIFSYFFSFLKVRPISGGELGDFLFHNRPFIGACRMNDANWSLYGLIVF